VADETGAGRLKVIAPACHDTGSAVAAVPAENEDFAWISSGTWSILGAEVRQPNLSAGALDCNFTNEGGVFGKWRLSKNITGLWLVQECRRQWQLSYDEITRLAEQARPFLAVIDPDSDLFLHPGDMPEKIRSFCKNTQQSVPATQGEIVRVALESLALKYRFGLMKLEELVGKRLEPLHILGGGTRNGLLNQLTADATQRTVVSGPVEATAIGNILMQAVAVGQLASLEEARSLVRRSFAPQIYQPKASAGWDGAFDRLQKVMKDEYSTICL
jgi:rhamnulokinase